MLWVFTSWPFLQLGGVPPPPPQRWADHQRFETLLTPTASVRWHIRHIKPSVQRWIRVSPASTVDTWRYPLPSLNPGQGAPPLSAAGRGSPALRYICHFLTAVVIKGGVLGSRWSTRRGSLWSPSWSSCGLWPQPDRRLTVAVRGFRRPDNRGSSCYVCDIFGV